MLYAVKTVARNPEWRSDEVLFQQALASQGDASLIRASLGAMYFNTGHSDEAEHEWLESLTVGPTNAFALDNLGIVRQHQHRYIESLDYAWRASRARPQYAVAHTNLAETLALMGRATEAEWQYRIAAAISPLSTRIHNSYGNFLFQAGRIEDARAEYERSVAADSTTYGRLRPSGQHLYQSGKTCRGRSTRFGARFANPFDSDAHFGLAKVLESTGHPADALREYEKGLEMDPSDAGAKAAASHLAGKHSVKPTFPVDESTFADLQVE